MMSLRRCVWSVVFISLLVLCATQTVIACQLVGEPVITVLASDLEITMELSPECEGVEYTMILQSPSRGTIPLSSSDVYPRDARECRSPGANQLTCKGGGSLVLRVSTSPMYIGDWDLTMSIPGHPSYLHFPFVISPSGVNLSVSATDNEFKIIISTDTYSTGSRVFYYLSPESTSMPNGSVSSFTCLSNNSNANLSIHDTGSPFELLFSIAVVQQVTITCQFAERSTKSNRTVKYILHQSSPYETREVSFDLHNTMRVGLTPTQYAFHPNIVSPSKPFGISIESLSPLAGDHIIFTLQQPSQGEPGAIQLSGVSPMVVSDAEWTLDSAFSRLTYEGSSSQALPLMIAYQVTFPIIVPPNGSNLPHLISFPQTLQGQLDFKHTYLSNDDFTSELPRSFHPLFGSPTDVEVRWASYDSQFDETSFHFAPRCTIQTVFVPDPLETPSGESHDPVSTPTFLFPFGIPFDLSQHGPQTTTIWQAQIRILISPESVLFQNCHLVRVTLAPTLDPESHTAYATSTPFNNVVFLISTAVHELGNGVSLQAVSVEFQLPTALLDTIDGATTYGLRCYLSSTQEADYPLQSVQVHSIDTTFTLLNDNGPSQPPTPATPPVSYIVRSPESTTFQQDIFVHPSLRSFTASVQLQQGQSSSQHPPDLDESAIGFSGSSKLSIDLITDEDYPYDPVLYPGEKLRIVFEWPLDDALADKLPTPVPAFLQCYPLSSFSSQEGALLTQPDGTHILSATLEFTVPPQGMAQSSKLTVLNSISCRFIFGLQLFHPKTDSSEIETVAMRVRVTGVDSLAVSTPLTSFTIFNNANGSRAHSCSAFSSFLDPLGTVPCDQTDAVDDLLNRCAAHPACEDSDPCRVMIYLPSPNGSSNVAHPIAAPWTDYYGIPTTTKQCTTPKLQCYGQFGYSSRISGCDGAFRNQIDECNANIPEMFQQCPALFCNWGKTCSHNDVTFDVNPYCSTVDDPLIDDSPDVSCATQVCVVRVNNIRPPYNNQIYACGAHDHIGFPEEGLANCLADPKRICFDKCELKHIGCAAQQRFVNASVGPYVSFDSVAVRPTSYCLDNIAPLTLPEISSEVYLPPECGVESSPDGNLLPPTLPAQGCPSSTQYGEQCQYDAILTQPSLYYDETTPVDQPSIHPIAVGADSAQPSPDTEVPIFDYTRDHTLILRWIYYGPPNQVMVISLVSESLHMVGDALPRLAVFHTNASDQIFTLNLSDIPRQYPFIGTMTNARFVLSIDDRDGLMSTGFFTLLAPCLIQDFSTCPQSVPADDLPWGATSDDIWAATSNNDSCGAPTSICNNNGECNALNGVCQCESGFSGDLCQQDQCQQLQCVADRVVDPVEQCVTTPSIAPEGQPTVHCNCKPDYTGDHCESFRPCSNKGFFCMNRGRSSIDTKTGQCTCDCSGSLFTGNRCQQCSLSCQHGGSPNLTCTGCTCPPGYIGDNCECAVLLTSLRISAKYFQPSIRNLFETMIDQENMSEEAIRQSQDMFLRSLLQAIRQDYYKMSISNPFDDGSDMIFDITSFQANLAPGSTQTSPVLDSITVVISIAPSQQCSDAVDPSTRSQWAHLQQDLSAVHRYIKSLQVDDAPSDDKVIIDDPLCPDGSEDCGAIDPSDDDDSNTALSPRGFGLSSILAWAVFGVLFSLALCF